MNESTKRAISSKWITILEEYEKVKNGNLSVFKTVNQLCSVYHINRKDIAKYYGRWIDACKDNASLLPHQRGPKKGKYKILSKEEERIIIKIHRRLGANGFELSHILKENNLKVHPSVSTIYRTFKRYPLNKTRKEKIKRYVKRYPGEMLHADTHQINKSLMKERKLFYLFGIIDDYSRLAFVKVMTGNNSAEVSKAFSSSIKYYLAHGIKIERVLTDNGGEFTAFTSRKAKDTHFFETMLGIFGIKHSYTRPYHPQTNGKIERFWRILNEECLYHLKSAQTFDTLSCEIDSYLYCYNYQRRHGALGYDTPLNRLRAVTELLK